MYFMGDVVCQSCERIFSEIKLAQVAATEFTMLDIEFAAPPRDLEWMEHAGKDALGQPYPFKPKQHVSFHAGSNKVGQWMEPGGSEESCGFSSIQQPEVAIQKPREGKIRKTSEASDPTQTDAVKNMTPLEWLHGAHMC